MIMPFSVKCCLFPCRAPRQRTIPFGEIRTMQPEEFVRVLAEDLGTAAVVAGSNYRFGEGMAGGASA